MTAARITTDAIDPGALLASVASPACGAAVLFVGTVRDVNAGRRVQALDYAAYVAMAEEELGRIVEEAQARFGGTVAAVHRIGALAVGETSVAVAAAHPHRGPAFDASRYVIEEVKRRVPIWKREQYADGESAWVDPAAPPPVRSAT